MIRQRISDIEWKLIGDYLLEFGIERFALCGIVFATCGCQNLIDPRVRVTLGV